MDRLEELKLRFQSILNLTHQKGVRLTHMRVQGSKVFIQGIAPSQEIRDEVWNQIRLVDAGSGDITFELSVDETLAFQTPQVRPVDETGDPSGDS